jgi:hypothetical protein
MQGNKSDIRFRWLGLAIIWVVFLLTRLPFFIYMPLPGIYTDSGEYYNILSILEQGVQRVVGIPQFGYPLFLKLCEMLVDRLWFVVVVQSMLSLLAVSWFYWVYARTFGRWLVPVAVLMSGYQASRMSLMWDTFIYPDSLLGSLFLMGAALLMDVMVNGRHRQLWAYCAVMTFAIAVRPSGLVMLPPLALALLLLWRKGLALPRLLRYTALPVLCLLGLSTVNLMLPTHRVFWPYGTLPASDTSKELALGWDDPMLQELAAVMPHPEVMDASGFHALTDTGALIRAYDTYAKNPVALGLGRLDRDTVLFFRSGRRQLFDLDSLSGLYADTLRYRKFRQAFASRHADTLVIFGTEKDWRYGVLHLPYFFTLFVENGPKDPDDNFYGKDMGLRWMAHYVDMRWVGLSLRDHRLVALEQVTRRTAKEVMVDEPMSLEEAGQVHKRLRSSHWYRWILAPYYRLHGLFFRSHVYIAALFLALLTSMIGLVYKRLRCPLSLYTLAVIAMLLGTLVIHLFVFKLVYDRYIHQIAFVYYFAVAMLLPLLSKMVRGVSTPTRDVEQ